MISKVETKVQGAYCLQFPAHQDDRGFFYESFNREEYKEIGIPNFNVAQINHSISNKFVLRGLHYQSGLNAQAKIVWLTQGEVLDVFVDLRKDSPTYGKWDKVYLRADGERIYIPKGCAHGFLALSERTEFNYLCSNSYNKESERCLLWNDKTLGINWSDMDDQIPFIISEKDKLGKTFEECEKFEDLY